MAKEEHEHITATDDKGNTYHIPRTMIDVRPVDWKARVVAAGSLLIAAGAIGGLLFKREQEQKPPEVRSGLVATVEAMQTQQAVNEVGLCVNENILRQAMGAKPIGSEDCQEEHARWAEAINATPSPTP